MVAVPLTENHSGQIYLACAVRLATPEGCSAARLCLTRTKLRLAGQRGVGLLVSIVVFTIRLDRIMPEMNQSVNGPEGGTGQPGNKVNQVPVLL